MTRAKMTHPHASVAHRANLTPRARYAIMARYVRTTHGGHARMLTKLAVDSDLTHTSLDTAIGLYMEEARGVAPTTLLTSTWNAETAYRIMLDRASKLVIVPVPGFPRDAFAVTGQCGLVYSPGA